MILLFDVDGVLIEHRAYRAGIGATCTYFGRHLGFGPIEPSREEVEVFEAHNIIMEWDMSAIIVAALLLRRLRAEAQSAAGKARLASLPAGFWPAWEALAVDGATPAFPLEPPEVASLARQVGQAVRSGERPSQAALRLFGAEVETSGLGAASVQAWLAELLGHVYDIDQSPAMQVFQNYILGETLYARHYAPLPARVAGTPLLEALDRSALAPEVAAALLARRAAGDLSIAIYTARPSLAPAEAGAFVRGYAPEAEIARDQTKLADVPVMGFGKMDWVARQLGRDTTELLKPSPVHGLAAMAVARTGRDTEAISAALAVERGEALPAALAACAGETVHVFEDSSASLRGVAQGVERLNRHGLDVRLVCHGIAPAGSPKRAPLAAVADAVHANVNDAVLAALAE